MNSVAITFPPELPVSQKREEIARAIRENQVVIVAGETGSGKTTQLPKICLELGRESIAHTQPRRIAARTIAERIADELGQEVGDLVGYQVRFTDRSGAGTKIKLMTDGILLNELQHDRTLGRYDTIIIDEAHERSLNIDFLVGYLKRILPKRPDLKVIITSATIDPESFSRHFDGAPIVEVSGRTFPVEVRYRPLAEDAGLVGEDVDDDQDPGSAPASSGRRQGQSQGQGGGAGQLRGSGQPKGKGPGGGPGAGSEPKDLFDAIGGALDELAREAPGDVLVFLSGESEIRDAQDALAGKYRDGATEVLPLYGRLSSADQHRVFERKTAPGVRRRVILATNVAETSLTVPGIKYVIDAGQARISRYSAKSKVQRLPIEAISQASANQRSGRSGRTSDGIAIRLYSDLDYGKRPEFTEPEILRTNLAAVILQMVSLGLGDITEFPFLQPPDSRGVKAGLDLLTELGALESTRGGETLRLTRIGRDLARLPMEPRFARMIVESKKHSTSREVMVIVAGMTIQDPRERPLERRQRADELHARFADPTSDFLTILNLWNYLEEKQKELSSSAFRRLCKAEFLNYLRVREWQDVLRQLRQLSKPLGLTIGDPSVNPDGIHRSILAGLLSHIGLKDMTKSTPAGGSGQGSKRQAPDRRSTEYIGARQMRFAIFPGSALAKKQPAAVMSAELVETSRLFARTNAAIDPAWAEPLAGNLVRRSYSEPHWEKKQGAVVAHESVTLFGVPIVTKRRLQYSRVDPELARELFIRHALVAGEWESPQAFDRANRKLRKELEQLEERTRRRDILLDDEAVFAFYDARVPSDVVSQRTFEGWWRKAKHDTPDLLTMTTDTLLPEGAPEVDEAEFPTQWRGNDVSLGLKYRFEPGAEDDGVTATVPLAVLPRLESGWFEGQVPGLRTELVTALIRSLPKHLRKNLVPAGDWAAKLVDALPEPDSVSATGPQDFHTALAATMSRLAYINVTPADFDLERIPSHLKVTYRVVGERGNTVAVSKDLSELQAKLGEKARSSVARSGARVSSPIERAGLTSWDFEALPASVESRQHGSAVRGYPALIDKGETVDIVLQTSPADQAKFMPAGVRLLLLLSVPSPLGYVNEHLSQREKLLLARGPYRSVQALLDDCLVAVADDVIRQLHPDGLIWTAEDYRATQQKLSATIMDALFAAVTTVAAILDAAKDAEAAIKKATNIAFLPALSDAKEQVEGLVFPGFIASTGLRQLAHLPRYLKAVTYRMSKLPENPARDRAWQVQVEKAIELFKAAGGSIPLAEYASEGVVTARWLIEELRVSFFAQQLGAATTVSVQRIQKALKP